MKNAYEFLLLDVFTKTPRTAGPLAIVINARAGLTDEQMVGRGSVEPTNCSRLAGEAARYCLRPWFFLVTTLLPEQPLPSTAPIQYCSH